jgi:predicted RNA-binding Zn ribbon-like protein
LAHAAANEYVFQFTGGRLCLDFANTVGGRRDSPQEHLNHYEDLVAWGRQAGVLRDADARHLLRLAVQRPRDAARTLAEAIALREALFRIFSSVNDGAPASADLDVLDAALSRALTHLRIVPGSRGFEWSWAAEEDALDRMLWPVVRSAADLLASDEVFRVGRCAGQNCDWLFLDASRNHSRRWCDMRDCGNREKARRYYARKKASC